MKNARVHARERHLWLMRRGGAAGLDFDHGALLPCRPPSNPQPSWRAAAHHLIRLNDLRLVPRPKPPLPCCQRESVDWPKAATIPELPPPSASTEITCPAPEVNPSRPTKAVPSVPVVLKKSRPIGRPGPSQGTIASTANHLAGSVFHHLVCVCPSRSEKHRHSLALLCVR
jgi:hypothetical protein